MKIFVALAAAFAVLTAPALAQTDTPNDPAIGVYRFSGGREAYIEYLPDIQGLALVEFPSGRVRPLRRVGEQSFTFGPTIGAAEPVVATLSVEDGRLRWSENGRNTTVRAISLRTENVSIRSGEITLSGTLTLPRGPGPHPAIVLLHGGGAQTRDFFWLPHFLALRGFVVLAYDKRGVGQSTGDWRSASVQDLADDALAAVAFLRADRRVRDDRIGLYGASAGGWTAPVAAQRAPDQSLLSSFAPAPSCRSGATSSMKLKVIFAARVMAMMLSPPRALCMSRTLPLSKREAWAGRRCAPRSAPPAANLGSRSRASRLI